MLAVLQEAQLKVKNMKKNLLKYTLIIASFIVSSCSPSSPSCDPDFEDCTSLVSVKMDDDKNKNYVMRILHQFKLMTSNGFGITYSRRKD